MKNPFFGSWLHHRMSMACNKLLRGMPAHRRRRDSMKAFYRSFIKPGDLCFDVGANIGNRTEVFLELGARVIAVEPQPMCLRHLRKRFLDAALVTIIDQAIGDKCGEGEIYISNANTISSMSDEWIRNVQQSGRFPNAKWDRRATVRVTTLDTLIGKYGTPAFCKVDVEGYEDLVFRGLSTSLPAVSFEFTPEYPSSAIHAISRLAALGEVRFNYSIGESMQLSAEQWVSPDEMKRTLLGIPDKRVSGDIYATGWPNGGLWNKP